MALAHLNDRQESQEDSLPHTDRGLDEILSLAFVAAGTLGTQFEEANSELLLLFGLFVFVRKIEVPIMQTCGRSAWCLSWPSLLQQDLVGTHIRAACRRIDGRC